MLNELREFETYVENPLSLTPRVMPYMLTEHFSEKAPYLNGLEDIMTIIARGYLFSKGHKVYDAENRINEELIENAIELLHRWTGFSDTKYRMRTDNPQLTKWMKKHSVTDSWLKQYWMYQFQEYKKKSKKSNKTEKLVKSSDSEDSKKAQDKLDELTNERWDELERKWNYSLNSSMDYSAVKITYKNVIANALEKGPLRNRYLVFKRNEKQVGKKFKKSESKPFAYLTDKSGRQGTSDIKIIKIIAAYLINEENHPVGQSEIWIKSSDLSRWYAQDDSKNGAGSWYPDNVNWKGQEVYTFKRFLRKYTKVIIKPEYLKEYDFQVIDPADAKKYQGTHWILEDLGHGLKGCWDIK